MTLPIPASISPDDRDEIKRLLLSYKKGDEAAATRWLTETNDVFGCPPVDLLKRDDLGVVVVLDYLKDAVSP